LASFVHQQINQQAMQHLPIYIATTFIITTLITLVFLYKASHYSKPLIVITLVWLALQAALGLSGFYQNTTTSPPRFGLLLVPPVIFIIMLFLLKKGRQVIDNFDVKTLTLLHVVRILVELVLYTLYLHKAIPRIMTFEGRNFDILCGLTAPFIYYFGYVKPILSKKILLAWNVICLLLLANIAIIAVLSAPLPFQQLAFDQPDIALLYFPFVWLPCFVVPAVLFAHLSAIRRLYVKFPS
jgi:hypothetical protein